TRAQGTRHRQEGLRQDRQGRRGNRRTNETELTLDLTVTVDQEFVPSPQGEVNGARSLSFEFLLAVNADVFPAAVLGAGLVELDLERRVIHDVVATRCQEQAVAVAADGPVGFLRTREE